MNLSVFAMHSAPAVCVLFKKFLHFVVSFAMQECFHALHQQFPGSMRIRWLQGLILEASSR